MTDLPPLAKEPAKDQQPLLSYGRWAGVNFYKLRELPQEDPYHVKFLGMPTGCKLVWAITAKAFGAGALLRALAWSADADCLLQINVWRSTIFHKPLRLAAFGLETGLNPFLFHDPLLLMDEPVDIEIINLDRTNNVHLSLVVDPLPAYPQTDIRALPNRGEQP